MKLSSDDLLLDHLLSLQTCCERAMRIADGIGAANFETSEVSQLAMAMAVAQIGEVSGRMLKKWPQFCLEHPDLELVRSSAMRNRLIHGYDQIDMATLWDTVQAAVPAMLEVLGKLIADGSGHEA